MIQLIQNMFAIYRLITITFHLNNTRVFQQHGVVAAIAGLLYFIRKLNKFKYRMDGKRNNNSKYDNSTNKRPANSLVVNNMAAVVVVDDNNQQNVVVGDSFSGTIDDKMHQNHSIAAKNIKYSGFKGRQKKDSLPVVVVDIENDEQET